MTEAVGWITPDLHAGIAPMDRFPRVHAAGSSAYRPMLEAFCQQHGYAP